jgi:hypothetical protein
VLKNERDEDCVIIALDDYLEMSPDEPVWEDDVFDTMPATQADIRAARHRGPLRHKRKNLRSPDAVPRP